MQEATLRDALGAVADPRKRPSDGILVQASVLARLAGMKLLRLEATVVLVPADVSADAATRRRAAPRLPAGNPAGRGLADAVQRIDEGAHLLAESRREQRVNRALD